MRWHPASVRVRLTLWHVLVLAAVILVFSGGVYFFLRQSLQAQLDGQLLNDATVIEAMSSSGDIEETADLEEVEQEKLIEYFQFRQNGRPVFRTQAWQRAGLDAAFQPAGTSALRSAAAADGQLFRFLYMTSVSRGDTVYVAVARPESPLRENLYRLRLILAMGLPVALLLAVAGGFLLAGRALSPIQTMAAKARLITADNLADRLPVGNPSDELGQLATVFNQMLSRLQDAFERLRRFTADASHQLRTPLTVIRSVGEVGLRREQDAAAYRETIGSMLEEADRLARLTENLLALTRLDAESSSRQKEPTEISALVAEAVDCLRVLAEEKCQTLLLNLEPDLIVPVDRVMIRQAVINILDNAIKYSPPGGAIFVSARRTETGSLNIAIEDEGPGIPVTERSRIFERFYRIPNDSAADEVGAGLGLSIAQRAVECNGGHIEVSARKSGGSIFRIII
jgi:heavy metal sensor kinase